MQSKLGLSIAASLLLVANSITVLKAGEIPNTVSLSEIYQTDTLKVESDRLYQLGKESYGKSDYQQALIHFQNALKIYQKIGDKQGIVRALTTIGAVRFKLSEYASALDQYQQALDLLGNIRKTGDNNTLQTEGDILNNIANIYQTLGQYDRALSTYQQAFTLFKTINNEDRQGRTLFNIGSAQAGQQQYAQALASYQKALVIHQQQNNIDWQAKTLNGLGDVYGKLHQYTKALESLELALAITREGKNRQLEGRILDSLGDIYKATQQFDLALTAYQDSLAISQLTDRAGEAITLGNIGDFFVKQRQIQSAIAFYKQSVNTFEAIRQDLRTLTVEQQKSYTQTIATTYRSLADLLLSQGRILEAQQVLELLKIQEIQLYQQDVRSDGDLGSIAINPVEQELLQVYGTLITFGLKLDQCEQTRCGELSALLDKREILRDHFNRTMDGLEDQLRHNRRSDEDATNPKKLLGNPDAIISAQPGTVLIYTLVLPDKLWILWAAKGGITQSIAIPNVGQQKLSETVLQFRELLQDPSSDLKVLRAKSTQLYNWLIPPHLQAELQANQIKYLVFSLDHVTRYIPISALFDGQQYLIEKYTTSIVISDRTDMRDRIPSGIQNTSILALGLTQGTSGFRALPNVRTELDEIVKESPANNPNDKRGIYPGLMRLDQGFTWRILRDNITQHQVLHIATHGKFEPGNAAASFIVLGDGEKLPIPRIKTLINLDNLRLVVLSACETALGGTGQDGIEISAISSYFLDRGAKAIMASLWAVNDASTSQLMQQFYTNLSPGKMGKAEALRQAQISLITGQRQSQSGGDRSSVNYPVGQGEGNASISRNLSHPYYWAPFILIGNGL